MALPLAHPSTPVEWRCEDGAVGPLDVASILHRDVAVLCHSPKPNSLVAELPWLLEYGLSRDRSRRFRTSAAARIWLEHNRVHIYDVSLPPET